ncbi:hypothetical protein [Actinoallomurus bryophytorum]|nr:hypothetical protein [Actinoallomurus bryophytorum]
MRVTHPSAALVAWGNAWLTGHVGLDEAVDVVERLDGPHVAAGLPAESGDMPLRGALAALRVAGLSALRLALPAPGDPLGLTGPPAFNTAAIEAEEAVLLTIRDQTFGLIPTEDRRGSSYVGTRWTMHETRSAVADTPLLPEADHRLTVAVREATESLMSVDGTLEWRPEIAEALGALRDSHHHEQVGGLAPGYPARAHRVAALAGRLAVVVDLARGTEGATLSAAQVRHRAEALRDLDHAVRRAQVAACNSVLDTVS